jgi:hypothetical protein
MSSVVAPTVTIVVIKVYLFHENLFFFLTLKISLGPRSGGGVRSVTIGNLGSGGKCNRAGMDISRTRKRCVRGRGSGSMVDLDDSSDDEPEKPGPPEGTLSI